MEVYRCFKESQRNLYKHSPTPLPESPTKTNQIDSKINELPKLQRKKYWKRESSIRTNLETLSPRQKEERVKGLVEIRNNCDTLETSFRSLKQQLKGAERKYEEGLKTEEAAIEKAMR